MARALEDEVPAVGCQNEGYKPGLVGGFIGGFKDFCDVFLPLPPKMIQFEKYVSAGFKTPSS